MKTENEKELDNQIIIALLYAIHIARNRYINSITEDSLLIQAGNEEVGKNNAPAHFG